MNGKWRLRRSLAVAAMAVTMALCVAQQGCITTAVISGVRYVMRARSTHKQQPQQPQASQTQDNQPASSEPADGADQNGQ